MSGSTLFSTQKHQQCWKGHWDGHSDDHRVKANSRRTLVGDWLAKGRKQFLERCYDWKYMPFRSKEQWIVLFEDSFGMSSSEIQGQIVGRRETGAGQKNEGGGGGDAKGTFLWLFLCPRPTHTHTPPPPPFLFPLYSPPAALLSPGSPRKLSGLSPPLPCILKSTFRIESPSLKMCASFEGQVNG